MIKGVNKTIIEVNNPDSLYFEKAVFYLKPNVKTLPNEVSAKEIARYISMIGPVYGKSKKRRTILIIATAAVIISAGLLFFSLR